MDGTAASRSTRLAAGRLSQLGAYWVMNRATATPNGTAMTNDATVVQSSSTMPNRGVSPPGAHSREVRKLAWSFRSAGIACARRKTPIKVTSAMTSRPAPREAPANRRSPSLPVEALSPSRFGRPDGPSPGNCEATDAPVMDDTFRGPRQSDRQLTAPTAATTLVWTSLGSGAYPSSSRPACVASEAKLPRKPLIALPFAGSAYLLQTML